MSSPHPCLYCGGTSFTVLHAGVEDRLRFAPGKRDWLNCQNCGSGVLSPFPRIEEIPSFYPPVYTFGLKQDKSDGRLQQLVAQVEFQAFYRPQYESQAKRILRTTHVPRHGRLLDVGCGRGLRLLSFRRLGLDVHGMDLIPEPVEYVKKELNVPAVCTDMAGLPKAFEPGSFDLITAFQVIEHVPDADEMIASCHTLLKPGGWVVITTPMVNSLQSQMFGARWAAVTEAPRHLSLPTKKGVQIALERRGFTGVVSSYDSAWMAAGHFGLSAFPGAATTHFYQQGKVKALLNRGLGAAAALLSMPWCWLENVVWRRPALGMIFGRKPE
ncbi:MAG TPA: class I SAM-dependent methyltransferase [Gemmataceae bacterium]|nr:class I SAM-dependent methyltransferase [Gemmataceae bacterium]